MESLHSKYRIGEKIGSGGMAEVYAGEILGDFGFKKRVAIKKMSIALDNSSDSFQLFVNEANLTSKLDHPNIVRVMDFFQDNARQLYIVMEFIDGLDLKTIRERHPLTLGEIVFIIRSILSALEYAHIGDKQSGRPRLIHRDISPHNIMVSTNNEVKLLDFGLAKALESSLGNSTNQVRGKVSYMSPEQAQSEPLDARSDLFSLGIVFYEMLTNKRLFRAKSDVETLSNMLTSPIERPINFNHDIPAELDTLVMALLQRDRNKRPVSASEVLETILDLEKTIVPTTLHFKDITNRIMVSAKPNLEKTSLGSSPSIDSTNSPDSKLTTTQTLPHADNFDTDQRLASEDCDDNEDYQSLKRSKLTRSLGMLLSIFVLFGFAVVISEKCSKTPVLNSLPETQSKSDKRIPESKEINPIHSDSFVPIQPEISKNSVFSDENNTAIKSNDHFGFLTFKAKPWAQIVVDGKHIGQTPQHRTRLKTGFHKIEFINEEYGKQLKEKVRVSEGKTKTLYKDMTTESP